MCKVSYFLLIELLNQTTTFHFDLIVYYIREKNKIKKVWEKRSLEAYTRWVALSIINIYVYFSVSFAKFALFKYIFVNMLLWSLYAH